jgi:hypothetical protein
VRDRVAKATTAAVAAKDDGWRFTEVSIGIGDAPVLFRLAATGRRGLGRV